MKRFLPVFVGFLFLLAVMVPPAFALSDEYEPTFAPDAQGRYSITHMDSSILADGEYFLLIVKGVWNSWEDYLGEKDGLAISDVTYVDQVTAVAGKAEFTGLIPYVQPNSTVFLSGPAYTSPALVGYIAAADRRLTLNYSQPGQYIVPDVRLETVEDVPTTTPSGTVGLNAAVDQTVYEATYTLQIEKPGYLSVTITDIPIDTEFDLSRFNLYGGDLNGNGSVNTEDLDQLLSVLFVDDSVENWSDKVVAGFAYKYADINEAALKNSVYVCNPEDLDCLLVAMFRNSFNGTYAEWLALEGGY